MALRLAHERVFKIPRVTRKYGDDLARHIGRPLRLQEDHVLQRDVIPAFDIGPKRFDPDLERPLELVLPIDDFALEFPVENAPGEDRRFERDGDARRKDRIEKFRRVPEQGETRSRKTIHTAGVT